MTNKQILIGIGVLAVAGIGVYLYNKNKTKTPKIKPSPNIKTSETDSQGEEELSSVETNPCDKGFSMNYFGQCIKNKKGSAATTPRFVPLYNY